MSEAGALYVDVGLRGLEKSAKGLESLRTKIQTVGSAGGDAIAALASRFAVAGTVIAGAVTGTTALLAEMGRADDAGLSLRGITAAWDSLWFTARAIGMEFGELLARVFDFSGGLLSIRDHIKMLWAEWQPTLLAMMDLVNMALIQPVQRFFSLFSGQQTSIAKTIQSWVESIIFFAENWRLYLQLSIERAKLFAENVWERLKAFAQNAVNIIMWFGQNWRDVLQTAADFVVSVFGNAADNIFALWDAVMKWISGEGWETPKFKSLLDGFRSSISEMPEIVEANVRDSSERIDAISAELATRRAAFDAARRAREDAMLTGLRSERAGITGTKLNIDRTSQYGFIGFADLARRNQEDFVRKLTERQTKAAEQSAERLGQLVDLAINVGLKIKGGSGSRFE